MIEEYSPWTGNEDLDHIQDALESGWVSPRGADREAFEDAVSDRLGSTHALAVDSGTAALHLALLAADLPDGSEVIVPDFTYCSTAIAVDQAGYHPVFADIDRDTLGVTAGTIQEAMTTDTAAIMTAHIGGHQPDQGPVRDLADDHGLRLIEDAAQCLGAHRGDRYAGTVGDIGCLSFSWNKPITTGKGGMVLTDHDDIIARAKKFADYGIGPESRFGASEVGYNYLMDSIRAGLGRSQLQKLDDVIDGRQRVADQYRDRLKDVVECRPTPTCDDAPEQFYCLTEEADGLIQQLQDADIGARQFYPPIHSMALYDRDGWFPVTEEVARTGVALPTSPHMTDTEVDRVASVIEDHLK